MKSLRVLAAVLLSAVSAGLCSAQAETVNRAQTTPPNETKSFVQGKVVQDPSGQGIRKVKLIVMTLSAEFAEAYEATTDETGQFKIEGLKPGVYSVRLERSGFVSVSGTSHQMLTFTVNPGQGTKNLMFHMQVAGAIVGKVVDSISFSAEKENLKEK